MSDDDEASAPYDELRTLVRSAFQSARQSGKADWATMRPAVLKNRLLDLTARAFSESAYGVERFGDVLDLIPDVVEVDRSSMPVLVKLRDSQQREIASVANDQSVGTDRVRDDLWHAILDFSASPQWAWDPVHERAVPATTDEVRPGAPRLPTVDAHELTAWRLEFVDANSSRIRDSLRSVVDEWTISGSSSEALPRVLRTEWFRFLKVRVLERLTEWFRREGIATPLNLLETRTPTQSAEPEIERLRTFVAECVHNMTLAELRSLNLPVAAVARVKK